MNEPVISFRDVSVRFTARKKEVAAVRNVTFDIRQGEVFGIIGTSGAGKSTLLRTINRLQTPAGGQVFVRGRDITSLKGAALRELRTNIGMIFQQFNLINTKTVFDNIAFVMKIVGRSRDDIRKRVSEVLELVGLSDRAQFYPSRLSGGEKQRAGIARALANNPYILLCDEPTSALDLETTNEILRLIKEINLKTGITTVIISHEMHVIKKICNRVAVMNHGRVVELDEVFNIFTAPSDDYTKSLIRHSLDMELPDAFLRQDLKTLKLIYSGEKAGDAVISDTIERFHVRINIVLGRIEYIHNQPFGVLVVELSGAVTQVEAAEAYLRAHVSRVEAVDCVSRLITEEL